MSSPRRMRVARAAVLLLALALPACGFKPLYGTSDGGSGVSPELAAVEVGNIPDRPGQQLRTHLELLLDPRGTGGPARYGLQVKLRSDTADVAIRRDETATRRDVSMWASYVLTDLNGGAVLTSGQARAVNSYNVVASDVATRAGEEDARDAALRRLAEELRTRLAIYFERHGAGSGTAR
ncbi:LPS-assembly lipoprotein [Constrictibacter sp. MBR-5]|uniref:LPS assembly lipoprotein LptE n=1 Tax=Constrictibacter sp. MBR-5 TaxID=3156467 RepID=UPI003393638E